MRRLIVFVIACFVALVNSSTISATSPGANGDIVRFGGNTISSHDPQSHTETIVEQDTNFTSSYFGETLDGQNYMSMFQKYNGLLPPYGYSNSPLMLNSLAVGPLFNYGQGFADTYHNSLSPDGSMIAYYYIDHNEPVVYDINTGYVYGIPITSYRDVVWSPNSKMIAYYHYNWNDLSEPTRPAIFDLESFVTTMVPSPAGFPLDWHPNGRYVAYAINNQITLYDIDTGATLTINPGGILNGSNTLEGFTWSPDGQRASIVTRVGSTYTLHITDGLSAESNDHSQVITDGSTRVRWIPSPNTVATYRFWSTNNKHHFYTANYSEAVQVMLDFNNDDWDYEGVAFKTLPYDASCPVSASPVHRFWSQQNHAHFFTIDEGEKNYVMANFTPFQWQYEGAAYCAYTTQMVGSVPLYRFWSDENHGHFFTTDVGEKNFIQSTYTPTQWRYENVAYYVIP